MVESKRGALQICVKAALKRKVIDLAILEMKLTPLLVDYFVICSGTSTRQVKSIASYIEGELKKEGFLSLALEGVKEANWILMDYGSFVMHIFYEPVRNFFDLEGLWSDVPRIPVDEC
ncbi:MAG: ribosome silencing factor [Thermodesulfobacteriota bacterium]|nr:ribosome silencing factor [Thermodesulfobacteriota bacterium]